MTENRFEATYLIETPLAPEAVAEVMAGEQSCGTFTRVEGETDALRLRAFPFPDSVKEFIDAHETVFVVEQNRDAQLRSLTLEQQLTSAGFDLQHSEINAPADGIAVNLGVHTEGAVVRAGETLLEVVPSTQTVEAKAPETTPEVDLSDFSME